MRRSRPSIDTLIFVTGRSKNAIVDYFDRSPELEAELEAKGKTEEALERVRNVIRPCQVLMCVSRNRWAWAMPCCVPPSCYGRTSPSRCSCLTT